MEFKKTLITFVVSMFAFNASAIDCSLIKHLNDPELLGKEKFWEEYSELSNTNKLNDRTLADLLKKHNSEPPVIQKPQAPVAPREPMNYSTSRRADKEIAAMPANLRKHYEEFMNLMSDKSGIKDLYANPGRWHMEKIKRYDDVYSVRLNGGVRVLFKIEKNDISIMEVNAARIHAI